MLGSKLTDQEYLKTEQYKTAANLNARQQLHERFSTNPRGWLKWAFDQLELGEAGRVLEVGCGSGDLWMQNRERIPAGWEVVLSDVSLGMVSQARRNLATNGKSFMFGVADVQLLPYPGESFDAVIANHMLYHIPERGRVFSEICRVLKPGGRLFAGTNGQSHLKEIGELIHRFDGQIAPRKDIYPFGLENGAEQLEEYFTDVSLRLYPDSLRVTEAEPLVAYIASLSGISDYSLSPEWLSGLGEFITGELAQRGSIPITKSVGLFIASKPG